MSVITPSVCEKMIEKNREKLQDLQNWESWSNYKLWQYIPNGSTTTENGEDAKEQIHELVRPIIEEEIKEVEQELEKYENLLPASQKYYEIINGVYNKGYEDEEKEQQEIMQKLQQQGIEWILER
ncbi:protein of unknown function [endosymbiont DhMRE of Dentiscutata heterogama]|uniref:hypothetical protein n=1 Tax=endosymbiont DhMRE of Dentiscutata heterogama TaxID=1609546 RepID=UPI000629D863|nr:hypothetical protein [endosymbiont DhMRE of Dentiscutata heterogama]CFW93299.1 protein of unknown function [endosymbiont DhMRE of Dentiscutata heterogama]